MKLVICCSIQFTQQVKEISEQLKSKGLEVEIPLTCQRIIDGELTLADYELESEKSERKIKDDVIKCYFNKIKQADAILVLNYEKKGISGYIGGNTFLEMGFAHVLGKPIFLMNVIPDISYRDEIEAMQPIILNEDISKIIL